MPSTPRSVSVVEELTNFVQGQNPSKSVVLVVTRMPTLDGNARIPSSSDLVNHPVATDGEVVVFFRDHPYERRR